MYKRGMTFLIVIGMLISHWALLPALAESGPHSAPLNMGGLEQAIDGAIRIGLSRLTTEEDIDALCTGLREAHDRLAHR